MKEGYKRTEVGIIPEEWNVVKVGELVNTLKSGLSRSLKDENVGIPCIRSNNIKNSRLVLDDLKYWFRVDDKGAKIEDYILKKGDIIINFINSISQIGKGCIFNKEDFEAIYTTNLLRIQINEEKMTNKFFYYYTQTEKYKKEVGLITKPAVNQASFTTVEYKAIKFPVPPLKEQQRIAEILSTVDSQIDDTDKLIEKIKELKKGLIQRLLTKGIGHTEFNKAEVGEIPVEWEIKSLGKVFKLSSGEFLSQKNIIDGQYPVYGGNGITGYHNEFKHKDSKIVIGRVGAKCGCVCRSIKESWITDNALYINEKLCEFDDEFMFYLLYYLDLNKFANQNAQPVISGQKIYNINIALPNLEEQKRISDILSSVDIQIEEYKNKKIKLEEIKKGLMQQLLTGKIRVS